MPLQPGAEVISINGRSVGEILPKLFANIFADGNVLSAKYEELNHFFPGYYANVIGTSPNFTVEYLDHSGKKLKATLKSVKLADIQSSNNADPNPSNSFNITYPAANVALIRIPVFMEPDGQPYEDFLKSSFDAIREKKISNLVLDLRDNGGGMDKMGKQLYAYLTNKPFNYYDHLSVAIKDSFTFPQYATLPGEFEQLKQFIEKTKDGYVFTMHENLGVQQPQEQPYLGKLYVLQNGSSFSVTAEFASIVRDNKRGIFIGDESGGALSGNNSGGFAFVRLPNTHLNLAIPLLGYYISLQHKQNGDRGILPDHSVMPTAKDVLQKKDVVLDYTLQLIGNK